MENKQTLPQIPQPQLEQTAATDDRISHEFTCEICIEPTSISDQKFRNTTGCSHPFCDGCINSYIRVKLEDNVGEIKCPGLLCDHKLDPLACAPLVGPSLFVRWCDLLCEAAAVAADHCYCPYTNCNALIVNECRGDVRRSSCPKCKRLFCFQCKRFWHGGFGCEESSQLLRDSNDEEFRRLVELKRWSRCPQCRYFVQRVGGCPAVKCRCGARFCYICGGTVCRCHNVSAAPRELTPREVVVMDTCVTCAVVLGVIIYLLWKAIK